MFLRSFTQHALAMLLLEQSSSGFLPSRQVQMFDVATPLVVGFPLSAFLYAPTIIQSSITCLGLHLDLFYNTFPSITFLSRDLPLRVCPIHFFCYCLVSSVRMRRDLSSPIVSNTSSFLVCSVQLTFSILLQIHISNCYNRWL